MKLYIAEKREVAKAINEALSGGLKDGVFVTPSGDKITWLYGHLLQLQDPEEQNPEYQKWQLSHLPMSWEIATKALPQHKKHLQNVINLIHSADEIIHAGDPDPEGQRLVDEVLEFANNKKPVRRLLINDNNASAIQKALSQMKDNSNFYGLSQSALARAVGDQRYGYNLTRLYTLLAQKKGYKGVLSVGRVQTPILGLIVRRDKQIEEHKSAYYYLVNTQIKIEEKIVKAQYLVQENDTQDEKKRLIDKNLANEIAQSIKNKEAIIIELENNENKISPPLPYNLLALQADASLKYGFSPKKVLEITQELRDQHKAITYNRSDCRYLNDERHQEARALLEKLAQQYEIAKSANYNLKSKAFDSEKVTAHHAIIPTENIPEKGKLSLEQQQIYDLITNLYIAQFYPARTQLKTKIIFEIENLKFIANSTKDLNLGWYEIVKIDEDNHEENDDNQDLSLFQKAQKGKVVNSEALEKKTQPPKKYTMSALLKDLASIAKYVTNPKIKALLLDKDADKADEKGGIGTPATRDAHIETLFTRGYVENKGKNIISTKLGRELIEALPDFATTPDLTALWHEQQKQIENGTITAEVLLKQIDQSIKNEITRAIKEGLAISLDLPKCPKCQNNLIRRNGKNGYFWGCSNYPECKETFSDKNGKPDFDKANKQENKDERKYPCPKCNSYLIRRSSPKYQGKYFWGCSKYPECKFTTYDDNGKPKDLL